MKLLILGIISLSSTYIHAVDCEITKLNRVAFEFSKIINKPIQKISVVSTKSDANSTSTYKASFGSLNSFNGLLSSDFEVFSHEKKSDKTCHIFDVIKIHK